MIGWGNPEWPPCRIVGLLVQLFEQQRVVKVSLDAALRRFFELGRVDRDARHPLVGGQLLVELGEVLLHDGRQFALSIPSLSSCS